MAGRIPDATVRVEAAAPRNPESDRPIQPLQESPAETQRAEAARNYGVGTVVNTEA